MILEDRTGCDAFNHDDAVTFPIVSMGDDNVITVRIYNRNIACNRSLITLVELLNSVASEEWPYCLPGSGDSWCGQSLIQSIGAKSVKLHI